MAVKQGLNMYTHNKLVKLAQQAGLGRILVGWRFAQYSQKACAPH